MVNCEICEEQGQCRPQVWPEKDGDTHVLWYRKDGNDINVDVGSFSSRELKEFLFYGFSFL